MDIKLNGRTQKVAIVLGIFGSLMAGTYFLYLQPELTKLDPIIKQDAEIKVNLKTYPLKLYSTQDVQSKITTYKKDLEDLKKKNETDKPVVTQLTDKDIIVLFGNLTKQLGIDVSNYKFIQDSQENINVNTTFIGHYQDLALLFQALDQSKLAYGVNALEVKQVVPDAPSNQNNALVYKWAQGKPTEVTNDLPLFLPNILGILGKKETSVSTPDNTSSPAINSDTAKPEATGSTTESNGATVPVSPTPSNTPAQQVTDSNTASASVGGAQNSSYDKLKVASQDLRVQIKVDLSVSKYAVGLNLQTSSVPLGRNNPWAYFVPENFKNYLGKSVADFGNGGSDSSVPNDMARLLASPDYVRSEIERTRSVIANRDIYALNTTQQTDYLYLLLFLDFKERVN
jgi:hypothetical protein